MAAVAAIVVVVSNLSPPVPAQLGTARSRVSLHQIDLGLCGVPGRAVGELARQDRTGQQGLPPDLMTQGDNVILIIIMIIIIIILNIKASIYILTSSRAAFAAMDAA